jgi:hypothetical protein
VSEVTLTHALMSNHESGSEGVSERVSERVSK